MGSTEIGGCGEEPGRCDLNSPELSIPHPEGEEEEATSPSPPLQGGVPGTTLPGVGKGQLRLRLLVASL